MGIPLDQKAEGGQFVKQFAAAGVPRSGAGRPIKVGGNVSAANLINPVKPVYPAELQRAGVQGTVKLEAVISKDGLSTDIRVSVVQIRV